MALYEKTLAKAETQAIDYNLNGLRVDVADAKFFAGTEIAHIDEAIAITLEAIKSVHIKHPKRFLWTLGWARYERAYFSGDKLVVASFARALPTDLDQPELKQLVVDAQAGKRRSATTVTLGGETYVAAAGLLPLNFADRTTGVMVFESLAKSLEPVATVRDPHGRTRVGDAACRRSADLARRAFSHRFRGALGRCFS